MFLFGVTKTANKVLMIEIHACIVKTTTYFPYVYLSAKMFYVKFVFSSNYTVKTEINFVKYLLTVAVNNFNNNSLSYRLSAKLSLLRFIISSCHHSVGWLSKESSFIFYSLKSFAPRLGQQETKLCSRCVAGVRLPFKRLNLI